MHVLLDLDGTLTDSGEGIARSIAHALTRMGCPSPDWPALIRYVGPPLTDTFRTLLGTADEASVQAALRHYRERFAAVGIFENRVFPGIPESLSALREGGYRLWVATTKPHPFARQVAEHFRLAPHFAGVYGAELSGERAGKGELIRHLLASERIPPRAAIMIGDREHDILGARENGLPAIGVAWGYGSAAELAAARPEAVADTPGELPALVARLAPRDGAGI